MRQWTYEGRRHGKARTSPLWLYGELDGSSCVDDCDSDDGDEQLEFYVRWIRRHNPEWLDDDAVPIYWMVEPAGETAPYQQAAYARLGGSPIEDFLSYFTWPRDASTGEPVDWFRLQVRQERFPALAAAIGWVPSPLQSTAPLRSILDSRRQIYRAVPAT